MVGYHVAPKFARASIRKYGLDPSKAKGNFFTGENRVFVFRDIGEAEWYANYQGDNDEGVRFDIWKVETSGLKFFEDDSMFSPGAEGETSAEWTPSKVGKNRVKLWTVVQEAIGRNMHTIDTTPNTWDSFQDFEINYYPQEDGFYLMDVSFKGKKLGPSRRFNTQAEAEHQARMIIDKSRVDFMNSP